jgi:N-methylhydantoinase A/oxoprolinase/acetone carboxylase beta subunit
MGVEQAISGPAIIEDEWSTVVVDERATAWADALGHLHIDVAGAS